jgi:hypothetical protein
MGKKVPVRNASDQTLLADRIAKLEAALAVLAQEVALLENFAEYSAAIKEAKVSGSHARLIKYLKAGGKVPRGAR